MKKYHLALITLLYLGCMLTPTKAVDNKGTVNLLTDLEQANSASPEALIYKGLKKKLKAKKRVRIAEAAAQDNDPQNLIRFNAKGKEKYSFEILLPEDIIQTNINSCNGDNLEVDANQETDKVSIDFNDQRMERSLFQVKLTRKLIKKLCTVTIEGSFGEQGQEDNSTFAGNFKFNIVSQVDGNALQLALQFNGQAINKAKVINNIAHKFQVDIASGLEQLKLVCGEANELKVQFSIEAVDAGNNTLLDLIKNNLIFDCDTGNVADPGEFNMTTLGDLLKSASLRASITGISFSNDNGTTFQDLESTIIDSIVTKLPIQTKGVEPSGTLEFFLKISNLGNDPQDLQVTFDPEKNFCRTLAFATGNRSGNYTLLFEPGNSTFAAFSGGDLNGRIEINIACNKKGKATVTPSTVTIERTPEAQDGNSEIVTFTPINVIDQNTNEAFFEGGTLEDFMKGGDIQINIEDQADNTNDDDESSEDLNTNDPLIEIIMNQDGKNQGLNNIDILGDIVNFTAMQFSRDTKGTEDQSDDETLVRIAFNLGEGANIFDADSMVIGSSFKLPVNQLNPEESQNTIGLEIKNIKVGEEKRGDNNLTANGAGLQPFFHEVNNADQGITMDIKKIDNGLWQLTIKKFFVNLFANFADINPVGTVENIGGAITGTVEAE